MSDRESVARRPSRRFAFTDRGVRALKAPVDGLLEAWDATLPGFGVRVSSSGLRTFMVRYRAGGRKWRRLKIGNMPPLTLADARGKALAALRAVELGEDPAGERERARTAAGTVAALAADFLASREARKWARKTRAEFERLIRAEIIPALGRLAPEAVTRGEVRALVERIADGVPAERGGWKRRPAPYVANRVLQVLKLMWSWALDGERVQASPVVGLKRPHEERPRDIEYTDDQIRGVFAAIAPEPDVADLVVLLFLTGARLNEVQGMEWSELDLGRKEWRLPPERSKVGRKKPRSRVIPLVPAAVDVLERRRTAKVVSLTRGRFVFPAVRGAGHVSRPTKRLSKLKRTSGVHTFMPHGIRHTIRARLARAGVAPHVGELILGHALRGMEGQYTGTGVEFLGEMRAALEAWAHELERILAAPADQARA